MKKLVISILCILFTSMLFAETEYSLREYFKNNILELDPIEGFYDVEFGWIQYNPWGGVKRDVFNGTNMAIRRRIDNTFDYYNKKGEMVTDIYFTKITDGIYNCHFRVGRYQHTQRFTLDNGIMFNATHRVPDNKKEILFEGPVGSNVRVDFVFNGIKSYPTSAMYLEAAKEDARKAEQELQEALEKAKREAGWSGTGFALYQGHIVTNYHVVEDAKTILIKGIKGDFNTEYRATVVATDKTNDLAVLKIDDERFSSFGSIPYKIKKSMSDVGESVWALGYPMTSVMGDEIKFTDGKISSRTGIQGDMSVYQISVPIQPGNSGGPLFDNYGNIVGITSSGLNREEFNSENVNYAIKTSYLYNLIESTLTTSILPQGTAMQGQALTQKIKLAKNFVFMILCSSDPNFHKNTVSAETSDSNSMVVKTDQPANITSTPSSESKVLENVTSNDVIIQSTSALKPKIELDKQIYDIGTISIGSVETKFEITNKPEDVVNNTQNTPKSKNDIMVTDNSYYVSGMQYITTITKTSGWGELASELGVKEATKMLKKAAAKRGCDAVLVTNINRGFVTSVTGKLYKR